MIHAHGCQALEKAQCFHLNELIQEAYLQTGSSLIPQDRFGAYYLIIILGDLCNELHWPMHACKEDIYSTLLATLLDYSTTTVLHKHIDHYY